MRQGDTETATSIIPSSCSSTEALGTSRPGAETPPLLPPLHGQDPAEPPPASPARARHPERGVRRGSYRLGAGEGVVGRPCRGSTKAARPRSQRPRSSSPHKKTRGWWTPPPPPQHSLPTRGSSEGGGGFSPRPLWI